MIEEDLAKRYRCKVYSDAIEKFLHSLQSRVRTTLKSVFSVEVMRTRFLYKGFTYPIIVVAFEHPSKLGYFDPNTFELGFNKHLQFESPDLLDQIINHELAHYFTHIQFGPNVAHHGKEFRNVCRAYKIEESSPASISLPSLENKRSKAAKVAKLINLSTSSNPHEANLALQRAHDLMSRWGVSEAPDSEEFIALPILAAKKSSQKMRSIANILRAFYVFPVVSHGKEFVYLEIFGSRSQVEIAEYIGVVLDRLVESLWVSERTSHPNLKGLTAKNSFIRGIENGFLERINQAPTKEKSLIKLEKVLIDACRKAYPNLSSHRSRQKHDHKAFTSGKARGKSLQISTSLKEGKTVLQRLLTRQ